jgi:uncharacterized protein YndB with AHSA1/START domain
MANMTNSQLTTESTIYVTYIAASAEQIWTALTTSAQTTLYFFGRSVESNWRPGSPWMLRRPDGSLDVQGEVRECDRPRRLVLSWKVEGHPSLKDLPEVIVSYDIEPAGEGVTRLTMTEAHPTPIPAFLLEGGRRGWPMILSGLKSLLETGRALKIATPARPKAE